MSVSSIISSPSYVTTTSPVTPPSSKALWAKVGADLKSGDLSGAQSAFASLAKNFVANHPNGITAPTSAAHPERADIAQLSQALTAGSLSDAQTAFSQLKTDYQAANPTPAPVPASSSSGSLSVLA